MKFFNPTNVYKELILLQEIEVKPDITQKELANAIGAAPSMVNVYIRELEENNYMVRDYRSAKVVYYNITPEGVKRKNYLSITYIQELMKLYKLAKENVERFIESIINKGYKNILLYGAGEVAETILSVIRDKKSSLSVQAIIDDDKDKQGKEMLGYEVILREDIDKYNHDAIVIASYTFEYDIMNRLKEIEYPMDRVERFFGM